MGLFPITGYAVNFGENIGIGSIPLDYDGYYITDNNGDISEGTSENFNVSVTGSESAPVVTLRDAVIKNTLYVPGGTKLILEGASYQGTEDKTVNTGIQVSSTSDAEVILHVTGDGSLPQYIDTNGIVDSTESNKKTLIDGGTLNITNKESTPITVDGPLEITGDAEINTDVHPDSKSSSSITAFGDLIISGNAIVEVNNPLNSGLSTAAESNGDIIIKGDDTPVAEGEHGHPYVNIKSNNTAIDSIHNITVSGSAEVSAEVSNGSCFRSFYGESINLGGKITAKASNVNPVISAGNINDFDEDGIIGEGDELRDTDVNVTGDLTINGGQVGILNTGSGDVSVENGNLTMQNISGYGIFTRNNQLITGDFVEPKDGINGGNILIKNSTVSFNNTIMGLYHNVNCQKGETSVTIQDSEVTLNTTAWSIYDKGPLTIENSMVECTTVDGYKSITATSLKLNYINDLYKMTAGANKESAEEIAKDDQFAHLTDNYVKIEAIEGVAAESVSLNTDNLALYTNKDPKQATLTANVLPEGTTDPITWTSSNTNIATVDSNGVVTAVGNGTATITVTVGNFSDTCEVTVSTYEEPVDPPDPGPSYPTIDTDPDIDIEDTENGSVTVDPEKPDYKDEVTITPQPDEGYEVDEVTVTDYHGKDVEVTDNGDGTYTFTQPWGTVTIEVTFKEKPVEPDPPTPVSEIFIDVDPDAWYIDAVQYAYDEGLMTGTSDNTFEPNIATTRGMIVSILHRLEGSPVANYLMDYDDVDQNAWYAEAVRWASSEGVVGGYGDGTFQPNKAITREEMASILFCIYSSISSCSTPCPLFNASMPLLRWAM